MSEFIYNKEKYIEEGEQIIFENNTDSSFSVEAGIIFHKSGLYNVDISNNHVVISKINEQNTIKEAYQKGFNDAWEAARKITHMQHEDRMECFGLVRIYSDLTASEALAKLKAHEEKKKADSEIKVGDEVRNTSEFMDNAVGYFFGNSSDEYYKVLRYVDGKFKTGIWNKGNCERTGKHSYAVERMIAVLEGDVG